MAQRIAASGTIFLDELINEQFPGTVRYVEPLAGSDTNEGLSWDSAFKTIQGAHDGCAAGDRIIIAPGDYDEAVVITKDNLTLVGMGSRGSVAVAPSATDAVAITIDGTTSSGRVEEVLLVNIGGEGNGTGGGLLVKGNIRRVRFQACKFEGGAFGGQVRGDGAGNSVADVIVRDCEFAWTTTGLLLDLVNSGEPVTQVSVEDCFFHNCATDGVLSQTFAVSNLNIHGCRFDDDEAGTAPTHAYIGAEVSGTSGLVTGCYFPAAVNGGKVLLAATLICVGSYFTGGINTTAPT